MRPVVLLLLCACSVSADISDALNPRWEERGTCGVSGRSFSTAFVKMTGDCPDIEIGKQIGGWTGDRCGSTVVSANSSCLTRFVLICDAVSWYDTVHVTLNRSVDTGASFAGYAALVRSDSTSDAKLCSGNYAVKFTLLPGNEIKGP